MLSMDDFHQDGSIFPQSSSAPGDSELLELIKTGNTAAFEQLFLAYYPALVQFALRYAKDRSSAQDIVQDVFAYLWERRAEVSISTSIQSYLYGAVRNRGISYLRHAKTVDSVGSSLSSDRSTMGSWSISVAPDIQYDAVELAQVVERAIFALPERCQEVFRLYVDDRLTQVEIAEVLAIAHSTVRVQIARGMTAVRSAVSDHINSGLQR